MFRRIAALTALCAALVAWPSVHGRPLVNLDVVDRDRGDWLSPVRHRGQFWIAGEPGHRYAVRLTNTTGERVLVVLSIDGVNAVTGQTAHPSQTGYVLGPWQSTEINGWRKSLDDVAQFVFTDLPDSYAARTGRPDDVGVIGVAVFEEARPVGYRPAPGYPLPYPYPRYGADRGTAGARGEASAQSKAAAPAAEADAMVREDLQRQSLGTGHGEREWSPVSHTGFVRASRAPAQVLQLRYDDHYSLVARGVLPRTRRHPWHEDGPHAFPGSFVADPPRW